MFYRDGYGVEHESYSAACHYYGVDTPEMLAEEARAEEAEYFNDLMDRMSAGEVQPGAHFRALNPVTGEFIDDEIPF